MSRNRSAHCFYIDRSNFVYIFEKNSGIFSPEKKRYVIGPILLLFVNGILLEFHSESTCPLFYIRWGAFTFAFIFCACVMESCLFFIAHEHVTSS